MNGESWDIGRKKETAAAKARTDAKSASSVVRYSIENKTVNQNHNPLLGYTWF